MLFVKLKCEDIRNQSIILIDKKLYNVNYTVLSKDKKNIVVYANEINTDDFLIKEHLDFFTFVKKDEVKKIVAIVENLIYKLNKSNNDIKMISETMKTLQNEKTTLLKDIQESIKKNKENVLIDYKDNLFYKVKQDE